MSTGGTNTAGERGPSVEGEAHAVTMAREPSGAHEKPRSHGVMEWIVPAVFVALLLAQLLGSVRKLSQTSDEADHLHAGYRYWQCADLLNPEHPPLVKLVAAAPLHFGDFRDPLPIPCDVLRMQGIDFEAARRFLFSTGNPEAVLFRARAAVSIFAAGLLIVVWLAARRMFGFAVAVLASFLCVFEPNLLAHGALVTTDMGITFGLLFAIYVFYRYTERPNLSCAVLLGVACAVTFTAKLSGVLLVPMLLLLAVAEPFVLPSTATEGAPPESSRRRRIGRNLGGVAAALTVSVLLLWAAYGFRYSAHPTAAPDQSQAMRFQPGAAQPPEEGSGFLAHILPENFLIGVQRISSLSEHGQATFVLGRLYPTGQWFYFPVALLIKCTLAFLLLFVLSLAAGRFWWREHRKQALFLLAPAALYFAASMHSKLNLGVRHVLPVLPFLLLFAAAGAWEFVQRARWMRYAVGVLLVAHATTSLRAFPYYMSYANELWGGPTKVHRYLTDSNVDWGMGLLAARDYLAKFPNEPCWAIYGYHVDIRDYGIQCHELEHARFFRRDQQEPLPSRLSGIFLVSALNLSGVDSVESGIFWAKPFVNASPAATLAGGSMFVYRGEFDMSVPVGIRQVYIVQRYLRQGNLDAALEAARRAIELIPSSGQAHTAYCAALQAQGDWEHAAEECRQAVALFQRDPAWNAENIASVLALMKSAGMPVPSDAAPQATE
jgi:4-amino-4-deoxy-L-arabinose transferase-like glycosyltransferase